MSDNKASLAVLIVGMHRSGTSALSGVLNHLGVAVPEDLHPADQHNRKGYFEPERIIAFHEALLHRLGTLSDDPLPMAYDWLDGPVGAAAVEELAALLDAEFGDNPICLFKDPRLCRLVPVWTRALARSGRGAVAVLPFRHPLEVAGSLQAKAGLSRAYSLFLWLQHVALGERFTRGMKRSFTGYDALMDDWRAVASKIGRETRLAWPKDPMRAGPAVDAFLSGEMRHHARSPDFTPHDPLEALCARAWAALGRLQADPDDAAAMAGLDAVWAGLTEALEVSAPLVVSYQVEAAVDKRRKDEDKAEIARLFALVEERERHLWEVDLRLTDRERRLQARTRRSRDQDRWAERVTQHVHAANLRIARVQRRSEALAAERDALRADAEAHAAALHATRAELEAIRHSTFWAISHPIRRALARHPALRRLGALGRKALKLAWWSLTLKLPAKLAERRALLASAAPVPPAATPAPEAHRASAEPAADAALDPGTVTEAPIYHPRQAANRFWRVVFVSGEAHTPGHAYRIDRWAAAARAIGATAELFSIQDAEANQDVIGGADLLFLWRAPWTAQVETVIEAAQMAGVPVMFDVDDLMFEPELATVKLIDGIRSQGFDADAVAEMYGRVQKTLLAADYCSAPTHVLAERMRRFWKPAFVLPNGFDEQVMARSRRAHRRRVAGADGLVRIGYAAGSKTHQKDFAQAAPAVAKVLRDRPNARLVLFRHGEHPVMDIGEFPMFQGLEGQIEWRALVPIAELPDEVGRFDISIAPLEVGNVFCEAKSELKFFEASLAGAATVASPTDPFRRAIRDGETGFLAGDEGEWYTALVRLIDDPALRASMVQAAFFDSVADYGPERRAELFQSVLEQVASGGRRGARAFELELRRAADPPRPRPFVPAHEIVFAHDRLGSAEATVIIPLYNYRDYVTEALDSVAAQTVADLDLIVVDDASTDDSQAVARAWLERHAHRFNRALLIRNTPNAGLGFARNVGFFNADTPFVLPLDADNRLRPRMCEEALKTAHETGAAWIYPRIRQFGDRIEVMGEWQYDPARLVSGNFIDAMALIRKSAWADVGGYQHVRYGWEDYDFWCRLAEHGHFAERTLEVLAEYRVHGQSMLHNETEVVRNKARLLADMEARHPWLRIDRPDGWDEAVAALPPVVAPEPERATPRPFAPRRVPGDEARLEKILPILRCPETGAPLERDADGNLTAGGRVWPVLAGRPVLMDMPNPRIFPDIHVSNAVPERAIELIEATEGLVLNLSAGGSDIRFDHVVEAEVAIFRHTDVVADAHALPFADASFDLVVSMNAFEHYHSPMTAAAEIMRVLRPGGRLLVRTAFLQPLHEAPWHFYNCTRYGLERWFAAFDTLDLQVSDNFNPAYALSWQLSDAEAMLRGALGAEDADRLLEAKAADLVRLWRDPSTREGDPLWERFFDLPQPAQEALAAGFEFLGRKPG